MPRRRHWGNYECVIFFSGSRLKMLCYYTQIKATNAFQTKVSKCDKCRTCIMDSSNILADIAHPLENRIDPMLHRVQERVRELELELAQTKLAHVEAECRNQVSNKSPF